MSSLDYPVSLPNPTAIRQQPKFRPRASSLPGAESYDLQEYDYYGTIDVEFFLSSDHMPVFWAFWRDDLLRGGRWFNCSWPNIRPGGMVVQFLTQPRLVHVYNGSFRYSAQLQVRGASLPAA